MSMPHINIGDTDPLEDSFVLDKLVRGLNSSSFIIDDIPNTAGVYKLIFDAQNDQIISLTRDIEHLRKEAVNKNNVINHLLGIITTLQINGFTCDCDDALNSKSSGSQKEECGNGNNNSTPKHNSFGEKLAIPESNFDPGNSENIRNLEKPLYVCTDEWTNECMTEDADNKKDDEEIEKNGVKILNLPILPSPNYFRSY